MIYRTHSIGIVALIIATALLSTGCPQPGKAWGVASYQEGEKLAQARKSDLAIFYKDPYDTESGQMYVALESSQVRSALSGKATCAIVPEYKPNKKYMARFGVTQPPALVILHPDGTYHAFKGKGSTEQLLAFIKKAVPPGLKPDGNAQAPKDVEYTWFGTWPEATQNAKRNNQPILIVYKWWLSAPSNELIRRISDPSVKNQFGNMTHCILDWDYIPNREIMARFGIEKLPALVLVHRDGTFHALGGVPTTEEIVNWVTRSTPPGKAMLPAKPKGAGPATRQETPQEQGQ